eukprot:GHVU01127965.1.p1 GENE.GHVU01127965.1~~GHVU01127965.1.p1  ORF type:complete len:338 (-),score=43.28 GHVU01127965.1:422-1435(-)
MDGSDVATGESNRDSSAFVDPPPIPSSPSSSPLRTTADPVATSLGGGGVTGRECSRDGDVASRASAPVIRLVEVLPAEYSSGLVAAEVYTITVPATAAHAVISGVLPGDAVSKLYPHIKRARRKPDQPQQQKHQQQEQLVHPQVRGRMTSDLPGATSVDTAGAIDVPPAALAEAGGGDTGRTTVATGADAGGKREDGGNEGREGKEAGRGVAEERGDGGCTGVAEDGGSSGGGTRAKKARAAPQGSGPMKEVEIVVSTTNVGVYVRFHWAGCRRTNACTDLRAHTQTHVRMRAQGTHERSRSYKRTRGLAHAPSSRHRLVCPVVSMYACTYAYVYAS